MRTPLIAGNWKMHKTAQEAAEFVEQLGLALEDVKGTEVLLCPPFTALHAAKQALQRWPAKVQKAALGAQNVHEASHGAHTGEVSAPMLVEAGCTYVIIGHSERRQAGETDEQVNAKVRAAVAGGLRPILCVGESLAERQAGRTEDVVTEQVEAGLRGLAPEEVAGAVVAYEPIWAIGTGETATPQEASRVARVIRQRVAALAGPAAAERVRIQYGGSVNEDNIAAFMAADGVDGALVGGASLKVDSFAQIVLRTEAAKS